MAVEGGKDVRSLFTWLLGGCDFEAEKTAPEGVVPFDMLGGDLQFVICSLTREDLF